MLMNYHIGRLVLSSLCVGAFGTAGFWWCSFCRLYRHIMPLSWSEFRKYPRIEIYTLLEGIDKILPCFTKTFV